MSAVCHECGTPVDPDAALCPRCGTTYPAIPPHKRAEPAFAAAGGGGPGLAVAHRTAVPDFRPAGVREVVVTGVDIPFGDLVVLIFKFTLASIPAYLFLLVIVVILSAFFGGLAALAGAGAS